MIKFDGDFSNNFLADHCDQSIIVIQIQEQLPDWELAPHQHSKSQLLLTVNGLITVDTPKGLWVVPPNSALWIPANTIHKVNSYGRSTGYVAFIHPKNDPFKEDDCQLFYASTLLRALFERVETIKVDTSFEKDLRLMQCLLDEIQSVPLQVLHLAMPLDARLLRIAHHLLKHPEASLDLKQWSAFCLMSERNLTRLFHEETQLSINQWRRKLHVILALQWLSEGSTVHAIAEKLNYDSATSFIIMFKKIMKMTPKKYMTQTNISYFTLNDQ